MPIAGPSHFSHWLFYSENVDGHPRHPRVGRSSLGFQMGQTVGPDLKNFEDRLACSNFGRFKPLATTCWQFYLILNFYRTKSTSQILCRPDDFENFSKPGIYKIYCMVFGKVNFLNATISCEKCDQNDVDQLSPSDDHPNRISRSSDRPRSK